MQTGQHTHPSKTQAQPELPLFQPPQVIIPAIRIPQPDGSILFKAGKPVVMEADMSVSEAARFLGLSARTIEYQCSVGQFRTAYKPGGRPRSHWRIFRSEVLSRKLNHDVE